MKSKLLIGVMLLLIAPSLAFCEDIAQELQDISVTIKSGRSQGSGVIITRELKKEGSDESQKVNFVWTAGHVIDNLRSTRSIIDKDGLTKKVVEFKPAQIVKELVENGRKVGEIQMEAKVIKYSDADDGEDLALLMVRKQNFVDANAKFYCEEDNVVDIGTRLYHVGSLLGQTGSNSMTTGIISQVGRVLSLGSGDGVVFDQTTVTAFPGSSGGGVFLADGEHKGEYIGMLVRGTGETFNLIVPIRRMKAWAEKVDLLWAIRDSKPEDCPSVDQLKKIPVEEVGTRFLGGERASADNKEFPFLLHMNNE